VIFRAIPDAGTRVAALRVGEVDIIQAVPLEVADRLSSDPEINIMSAPGTQPLWLEMNIKHPLFIDENVRQALNHAIDKNQIIEEIYGSRAEPLPGPLSPNNPFVHDELLPYSYDVELARAKLEKAGWKESRSLLDGPEASIPIGDELFDVGILRDSQGIPFQFNLDTLPEWYPLAVEISAQLRMIGILVDIRLWEPEDIRPEHNLGNRVAYLDDWSDSAFDPVGNFDAKWHGYSKEGVYGQANFSGFNDPRVNALIRTGEITPEESERRAIYNEAQEIVYEKAPAIFLVLPEIVEAASVRVLNWEPASDGRVNLHDVCIQP
jgi:peptide/nickel transport system substrate-binding protein